MEEGARNEVVVIVEGLIKGDVVNIVEGLSIIVEIIALGLVLLACVESSYCEFEADEPCSFNSYPMKNILSEHSVGISLIVKALTSFSCLLEERIMYLLLLYIIVEEYFSINDSSLNFK
jgi:hypothetical protein